MDQSDRPSDSLPSAGVDPRDPPVAPPDFGQNARRAAADQEAADAARGRFRREGLPTVPPDERIAPLLESGELVFAVHHAALLDRREPAPGTRLTPAVAGELYVTSPGYRRSTRPSSSRVSPRPSRRREFSSAPS